MKKGLFIVLLAVFGGWSTGLAVVEIPSDVRSALKAQRTEAEKGPRFVEGQLLLKMKHGFKPESVAPFVEGRILRPVRDDIFLLDVGKGRVSAAVNALQRMPAVAVAEPNWLRRVHQSPNDAYYIYKWDLNNDGYYGYATADADMDWQEVYEASGGTCGESSTVLAVIDSGIDLNHPDLAGQIDTGAARGFVPHYLYALPPEDPTDENGHGTHVAGIARAGTNNDIGTAGVGFCNSIRILPLRVCDWLGTCPDDALISAFDHAIANGARVINMSLGGPDPRSALEEAINDAWDAGLVVVVSAGNEGTEGISYPAAYANAIAVGSTNWHDTRAAYSNYGPDLDVMAPGGELITYWDEGIYSTLPTYLVFLHYLGYYEEPMGYTWLEGTSMAAPQVSGLAALLFALDPSQTNETVRAIIESTADDLGDPGFDPYYGHGRVNVYQAVAAVNDPSPPPPAGNPPIASFSYFCDGLICDFNAGSSSYDTASAVFSWDFGDANSYEGSESITTHTYDKQGTYTVTLTVSDDSGAEDVAEASVRVKNRGHSEGDSGSAGGDTGDGGDSGPPPCKGKNKNDPECGN